MSDTKAKIAKIKGQNPELGEVLEQLLGPDAPEPEPEPEPEPAPPVELPAPADPFADEEE